MDAIIRQAVRDEIRRQNSNERVESTATSTSAPSTAANTSVPSNPNQRTVSRLSGLLDRIRGQSRGKKRKADKEHRIQVRWIHYNDKSKLFLPVRQKNGGGNRFVTYCGLEPPTMEELKQKASALFFPDGKSTFAGLLDDMFLDICDSSQTAIFEFPGDGTVESYLKHNGLYPSTTYLYLRSQNKDAIFSEFEDEPEGLEQPRTLTSQVESGADKRVVCPVCSCTFVEGDECIRCQQDREYEFSRIADGAGGCATETLVSLTMDEIRSRRIALLSSPGSSGKEAENEASRVDVTEEPSSPRLLSEESTNHDQGSGEQDPPSFPNSVSVSRGNLTEGPNSPRLLSEEITNRDHGSGEQESSSPLNSVSERLLTVHRSCVRTDLINHFKDPRVMNCNIDFKLINEKGDLEPGVGIGVIREVYTLFWNEFSISMTIGERERVPFVRHDYFVEEWEAVGRILVKGYVSVSYFPTFLSKAFICYCIFGNEVPDSLFIDSFTKYLSPVEEELIVDVMRKNQLPDEADEFNDFLERFQCRRVVNNENLSKVILEIAKQELVQKPHLMIASLEPFLGQLRQYPQFQTISDIEALYDTLKPTTKKVLSCLISNPVNEGERDAFKFLQKFIRGLDISKLLKFLQFTTGMDIMVSKKIEVTFFKCEGLSARPIAHTCGPLLEIPSTYANYVEFREDLTNVLNRDMWEMDIV